MTAADELVELDLDPRVFAAAARDLQRGRRRDRVALEYRLTAGQLAWIEQQAGEQLALVDRHEQQALDLEAAG